MPQLLSLLPLLPHPNKHSLQYLNLKNLQALNPLNLNPNAAPSGVPRKPPNGLPPPLVVRDSARNAATSLALGELLGAEREGADEEPEGAEFVGSATAAAT